MKLHAFRRSLQGDWEFRIGAVWQGSNNISFNGGSNADINRTTGVKTGRRLKSMKSKSLTSFLTMGAIIFAALVSTVALALDTAALDKRVQATLDKFYSLSDKHRDLVQNAAAVLVFPDITKGGIGIGGEHGDGGLLQNGKTVGYYSISGGSIGWTFGFSHHSEVILFKTSDARDSFLKSGDWALGADYSYAVMKKGVEGNYDMQSLSKPINVFVFGDRGLMDDTSLEGAKISKIAK